MSPASASSGTPRTPGPRLDEMVAATPASRDRYVDFLRAASIVVVVLGHWTISIIAWDGGIIRSTSALGLGAGLWLATWVFQVMPVFFFVGGYANLVAESARRQGLSAVAFIRSRLRRLLVPSLVLLGVWAVAQVVLHLTVAVPPLRRRPVPVVPRYRALPPQPARHRRGAGLNAYPPTLCYLLVGIWLIGLVVLARPALSRWLQRPGVWKATIAVNGSIMTLFLWHMTAFLLAVLLLWPLGFGHERAPSLRWWAERPLWLAVSGAILAVLVALFSRFEAWGRRPRPAPAQARSEAPVTSRRS